MAETTLQQPNTSVATDGPQGGEQTPTPDSTTQSVEDNGLNLSDLAEQLGVSDIMGKDNTAPTAPQPEPEEERQQDAPDQDEEETPTPDADPTVDKQDEDDADAPIIPEDDEESPEEEEDDDEPNEPEDTAEKPGWFQKRIDKLTRQKKEAKEEAQTLKAKTEELEAKLQESTAKLDGMAQPVMQATPKNPFADTLDAGEIDKRVTQAETARQWLIDHPRGGEIELPDGETVEISEEAASRKREELDELIKTHAPARKKFIADFAKAQEIAAKKYPNMLKPGHEHVQMAVGLIQDVPELLNIPDRTLVLGDYVTGALVRQGKYRLVKVGDKEAAAPAAKPAPASPPPEPSATAPARKPVTPKSQASRQRALETGNDDDITAALEEMLGAR